VAVVSHVERIEGEGCRVAIAIEDVREWVFGDAGLAVRVVHDIERGEEGGEILEPLNIALMSKDISEGLFFHQADDREGIAEYVALLGGRAIRLVVEGYGWCKGGILSDGQSEVGQ
jgi:hypothetical protein